MIVQPGTPSGVRRAVVDDGKGDGEEMRTLLWHAAALLICLQGLPFAGQAQEVRGTYAGYRGDSPVWTDNYRMEGTEAIEDRIVSADGETEREVTSRPGRAKEEIFTETVNGVLGYNVKVNDEFVYVYKGQGMTGMVMIEERPLVFDHTVPTHYGVLLGKYDGARGGTQKFAVIVPSKGDYCRVEITRKAPVTIPMGEAEMRAEVYQFRVEYKVYVTVWTLEGAPAAVYIPSTDEYMVDTRYPMLREKIQMLIKRAM